MAKKKTTAKKSSKKSTKKATKPKVFEPDMSFLPIWSEQLKRPVEELESKLEEYTNAIKDRHDNWKPTKIHNTARRRLYNEYKADRSSNASPWVVLPLYIGRPYDFGAAHYKKNMEAYHQDPKAATNKKLLLNENSKFGPKVKIDGTGSNRKIIPIEERKLTNAGKKNNFLGKKLPLHNWIQSEGGVALMRRSFDAEDWDAARPYVMTISGVLADPGHPKYVVGNHTSNKWYKTKATNRTDKENLESFALNATTLSKYIEIEGLEFDIEEIVRKYYGEAFYTVLGELQMYHDSFMKEKDGKQKCLRVVVTEGDVIDIVPSSDNANSHRMMIDDETLGFGDAEGNITDSVTCWIDADYKFDFGVNSRVMVFGKTSAGKKKDLQTQELTDEWASPSIAVEGIIVLEYVEPDLDDDTAGDSKDSEDYEPDGEETPEEEPDIEADEPENVETTEKDKTDKW